MKGKTVLTIGAITAGALLLSSLSSGPKIYDIVDQLPKKSGIPPYPTRPITDITKIVIHHSATPGNFGPFDFARYHVDHKGRPGISYHFVIPEDGKIYQTQRLTTRSIHTQGANSRGLSVCLSGNFENYPPTPQQIASLKALIPYLRKKLGHLPIVPLSAHRDYHNTACPGDHLYNMLYSGSIAQIGTLPQGFLYNRVPSYIGTLPQGFLYNRIPNQIG